MARKSRRTRHTGPVWRISRREDVVRLVADVDALLAANRAGKRLSEFEWEALDTLAAHLEQSRIERDTQVPEVSCG